MITDLNKKSSQNIKSYHDSDTQIAPNSDR